MQQRQLGQTNISTSVIGLGTWAIGGWMWGGLSSEEEAISAIQTSLDYGVNLIDTAPVYGFGLAEEIVGKAIASRRDQVILATKCGLVWHLEKGNHFFTSAGHQVHRYLGKDSIRYEVEQSLKRLKIDYIDLYQTHWQDGTTKISETMETLLELKKEGKIRAIGVSNVTVGELEKYLQAGTVVSAQEKFSMLDRGIETELLPYCQNNHISMLSYSPLALGLLSGKISLDRQFTGDDQRKNHPRFNEQNRRKIAAMLDEFRPIAEKYSISIAQLVIAWTVAQPGITVALCGARTPTQATENAKAGQISLTTEELTQIQKILQVHLSDSSL